MPKQPLQTLVRHLHKLVHPPEDGLTDGELLARFVRRKDPVAFAALVERHGLMVRGVCRRLLRQESDVDDAFQATFLVLLRKACTVRKTQSLGSWLYGVAFRIARRARAETGRRSGYEKQARKSAPSDPGMEAAWRELCTALDVEVHGLPEKYRAPIVLCYLECQTRDQAARQLGWSLRTLERRLEQGRERLRARLARRGITLTAALLATELSPPTGLAALPASLVERVVQAASSLAAGEAGALAGISPKAIIFADVALKGTVPAQMKFVAGVFLVAAAIAGGAGALAQQMLATKPQQVNETKDSKPAGSEGRSKDEPAKTVRTDFYGDPLPEGAIARMGTIQLWHYTINADVPAAFSPDGKVLTTAGVKTLRMWEVSTGKLLREIADSYQVSQIFCSPKGRFLATCGDECINLRDPNTGQILQSISTSMRPSAFSPDDKLLVTNGSQVGSVDLWETATGKHVVSLKGHKEGLFSPAFTSDGKTLFTMDRGKKVCLWDVATGTLRKSFNMQVPQWRTARLSPDGQTLAVASGKTVSFWDTESGQERIKLKADLLPQGYGMAFTPDGKTFATARCESWADLGQISLWNARTGELIRSFPAPARAMIGLEFAPNNRTLLSSAGGARLHLWDSQTGRELFVNSGHDDMIRSLAFTLDGEQVISMADNTIRLWDAATGRQVRVVAHSPKWGTGLSITRDGRAVLSGGYTCLRLNELATGKELQSFPLDEHPQKLPRPESFLPGHTARHVGLSADGRTIVSVSSLVRPMQPNAIGSVNVINVWDAASGKALIRREIGFDHVVHFLGLAPGARTLAISVSSLPPLQVKGIQRDESNSHQVLIQDVLTGRNIVTLPQPDNYSHHHAFSPDARTLVTTTNTVKHTAQGSEISPATFHFWELTTGQDRFTFQVTEATRYYGFAQMAFLPDARILATIRYDGTIQLWDAVTGKELFRRTGSDSYVSALAFSHDGKFLVTGHQDSTILVWDLSTAKKPENLIAGQPSKNQLEAWWSDLAGADAAKAYRAIWCLAEVPHQAMAMFRDRVHVAKAVSEKEVNRLIADLDSGEFTKREVASQQLSDLGEQIEPFLEAALKAKPTGEQRRRIEQLLTAVHTVHSPDQLRSLRAIEALEHIGTPEAGKILQSLAKGPPASRQTREAQDSLDRLAWKSGAQR